MSDQKLSTQMEIIGGSALGFVLDTAALEAKLEAMERAINTGRRIVLRGGVVGDYDGAYDSIDESSYDNPDNELGHHPSVWPGDGYTVVRLVNEDALAAAQQEQEDKRKWNDIEEDWKNDAAGG